MCVRIDTSAKRVNETITEHVFTEYVAIQFTYYLTMKKTVFIKTNNKTKSNIQKNQFFVVVTLSQLLSSFITEQYVQWSLFPVHICRPIQFLNDDRSKVSSTKVNEASSVATCNNKHKFQKQSKFIVDNPHCLRSFLPCHSGIFVPSRRLTLYFLSSQRLQVGFLPEITKPTKHRRTPIILSLTASKQSSSCLSQEVSSVMDSRSSLVSDTPTSLCEIRSQLQSWRRFVRLVRTGVNVRRDKRPASCFGNDIVRRKLRSLCGFTRKSRVVVSSTCRVYVSKRACRFAVC